MSAVSAKSRKQTISSFLDALDRHDVEVMMSHMSDECVFETASGPEIFGFRYLGREDVRRGCSHRLLIALERPVGRSLGSK